MRWHHPKRGLIAPGDFIPLAEDTGLIVPLGEWVVRTACAEAATWPGNLKVAINLSAAQLRSPDLIPVLVGALGSSGIAPQRLELEITESAMVQDRDAVLATLGKLHKRGVRIALDDFGTGYSSLSVLQNFPFDKIKIDRAFIDELVRADEEAHAVARAVIRFAASLGKVTTAEGVESKEQLRIIGAEDCTEGQGYYFGRPVPASEIAQLMPAAAKTRASAANRSLAAQRAAAFV